MKQIVKKETIIGACVLIALAVLFFGVEYLKGVNLFRPSNYYYAVYDSVNGLTVSAPVYINGFKVGQVNDIAISYDHPGDVVVTFKLDKEVKVPRNSYAVLESSLLGTASISLKVTNENSYYTSGDTIPSKRATGLMDGLAGDLMPKVGEIVPKVDQLLTNLNNITGDSSIVRTLRNIESLSSVLSRTAGSLNKSVQAVPALMDDVRGVVDNVNRISQNLSELTSSLSTAPIDSTLSNLNALSNDLAALAAKLNNPDSSLGLLINDAALYDNLTGAAASIDSLLVDIRKNPKRYINIKLL